jgi:KaiC/GvpD/RAD55 family RecA-like ATPase
MSAAPRERIQVGIPGFDEIVHGGLPRGRSTLLAGATGTGKTVFGLQFLWGGAHLGEPGVLVTFAERPEDLIANVASFGWDLGGLVSEGRLAIVDATPDTELLVSGRFDLGGLTARIAHALSEVGGTRLFMDPIDALFEEFSETVQVRRAFAAILRALRPLGATALISAERPSEDGSVTRYGAEEFAVDNVIVSRYPARVGLEDLLVELKHTIEEFKPTRLVFDSVTAVEHNAPANGFREFSVGLSGYLKARGVATMMTTTLPDLLGGANATNLYLSTIADAIIALRYFDLDSQVRRAILVLKVRGSQHASEMHEYEILSTGMSVKGPIRGIGGILAGLAQTTGSSNGASVFEP